MILATLSAIHRDPSVAIEIPARLEQLAFHFRQLVTNAHPDALANVLGDLLTFGSSVEVMNLIARVVVERDERAITAVAPELERGERLIRELRVLRDAVEDGAIAATPTADALVEQLVPLEAAVARHDLAEIADVLDRPVVRWVSSRGGPAWYARSLLRSAQAVSAQQPV